MRTDKTASYFEWRRRHAWTCARCSQQQACTNGTFPASSVVCTTSTRPHRRTGPARAQIRYIVIIVVIVIVIIIIIIIIIIINFHSTEFYRGCKCQLRINSLYNYNLKYRHNFRKLYVRIFGVWSIVSPQMRPSPMRPHDARGGATVLKVGGEQKKILTPPFFLASGGTKYCLDS